MKDNLFTHNTERQAPTFANINMLGKCNADCYFCLGKDIPEYLSGRRDNLIHFRNWPRFDEFLGKIAGLGIKKLYLTGQNTDALLYRNLTDLIDYVQSRGFDIGLRTNGVLATRHIEAINKARLETGYSIHTLDDDTNLKIMGTRCPSWGMIIPATQRCRVSIVVNRHNVDEFYSLVKYIGSFKNVQHVQARRISTETRRDSLRWDLEVYEQLHDTVKDRFECVREFYGAPIYDMDGVEVTFWRTVKTCIGSVNYFTDGTISDDYFVVKGYTEANGKHLPVQY